MWRKVGLHFNNFNSRFITPTLDRNLNMSNNGNGIMFCVTVTVSHRPRSTVMYMIASVFVAFILTMV